jgi:hypothetical protein
VKKLALLLLLLPGSILLAADKANPADFPLKLHITSSAQQSLYVGNGNQATQVLETVINGQPVQLQGYSQGVLALGDYPARINPKVHGPKNANTYDIYQGYDFLLPDGNLRTFYVTRLGPAVPAVPANP